MSNHHVSNDDQLTEEQMTFPYLLTLDNDAELLTGETVEELTSEEESEEPRPEPVDTLVSPTTLGTTKLTRSNSAPNLTTDNPTFATTLVTADISITDNVNTENIRSINETFNAMRNKLTEAQKEITDLRHRVFQREVRSMEHGLRMLTMENTLRKLVLLHPTLQYADSSVDNLTPPTTQPGTSSKRTSGGNSDDNPPQPLAKRTKIVQTYAVKTKEKIYKGKKPFCSMCNLHHEGPCTIPCSKQNDHGLQTKNCKVKTCFRCGETGHFHAKCPRLKAKSNNNA